jgi:hypothetical protein
MMAAPTKRAGVPLGIILPSSAPTRRGLFTRGHLRPSMIGLLAADGSAPRSTHYFHAGFRRALRGRCPILAGLEPRPNPEGHSNDNCHRRSCDAEPAPAEDRRRPSRSQGGGSRIQCCPARPAKASLGPVLRPTPGAIANLRYCRPAARAPACARAILRAAIATNRSARRILDHLVIHPRRSSSFARVWRHASRRERSLGLFPLSRPAP